MPCLCPSGRPLCFPSPWLPLAVAVTGHRDFPWAKALRTWLGPQAPGWVPRWLFILLAPIPLALGHPQDVCFCAVLPLGWAGRALEIYKTLFPPSGQRGILISELCGYPWGHIRTLQSCSVPTGLHWGGEGGEGRGSYWIPGVRKLSNEHQFLENLV